MVQEEKEFVLTVGNVGFELQDIKGLSGHVLNRAIHQKVFGSDKIGRGFYVPSYSGEIGLGFEVVKAMVPRNLHLIACSYGRSYASFIDNGALGLEGPWVDERFVAESNGECPTAEAICRAALLFLCSGKQKDWVEVGSGDPPPYRNEVVD